MESFAQSSHASIIDFVRRDGTSLVTGGRPFYAIGVNSYFLQHIAAYGDTNHVIEVFREANELGITTIRTWGFFDCDDSNSIAGIQWVPGQFNENGLRALDYVVAEAREHSIRLVTIAGVLDVVGELLQAEFEDVPDGWQDRWHPEWSLLRVWLYLFDIAGFLESVCSVYLRHPGLVTFTQRVGEEGARCDARVYEEKTTKSSFMVRIRLIITERFRKLMRV